MSGPRFSIVIPVYNRPDEIQELLESLTQQSNKNFEVIVVEDGSSIRCETIVTQYQTRLTIHYIFKPNTGPGPSRNMGYKNAHGDFFVSFDSDCILPVNYFDSVEKGLAEMKFDAWGGPDKAREDFTLLQRAMGYTMASVLTTGGIRGGKKSVAWFQPRSFNMGISRKVFEVTGGFKFDRYAEDIEFSIRIKNAGFKIGLIPEAYVFHKRRTNFTQFYNQVFNFGKGRALIGKVHPSEIKLTHWFPAFFLLATILMLITAFVSKPFFMFCLTLFVVYLVAIFIHSLLVNRNLLVALLSVPSALIQFFGYGIGFLRERLK